MTKTNNYEVLDCSSYTSLGIYDATSSDAAALAAAKAAGYRTAKALDDSLTEGYIVINATSTLALLGR